MPGRIPRKHYLVIVVSAVSALVWTVCYGVGAPFQAVPRTLFVTAIGIDTYEKPGAIRVKYGDRDASRLQEVLNRKVPAGFAANASLLSASRASRTQVSRRLQYTLQKAETDQPVFVFVSARGLVSGRENRGYLLGYDSQPDNPGTSVDLVELKRWIANSKTDHVYLFADVSRTPDRDNRIHEQLLELNRGVAVPKVEGILATQPPAASGEDDVKQLGAFAAALSEAIPELGAGFEKQFPRVFANVQTLLAPSKQKPAPVGKLTNVTMNPILREPSIATNLPGLALRPRRFSVLSAFGPNTMPALFLFQLQDPALARDRLREALVQGRMTGPGSAFELARTLGDQDSDRFAVAVELEDRARRTISRYGAGEQFPNDPFRPDADEYDRAADYLSKAAELMQWQTELAPWASFCSARASMLRRNWQLAQTQLDLAINGRANFSEALNARGVTYLETNGAPQAIGPLLDATQAAPQWAYARHNLALAYIEVGDYRSAQQQLEAGIRATPYHPYLAYNLGVLLQRQHRWREAESRYRTAASKLSDLAAGVTASVSAAPTSEQPKMVRLAEALRENQAEAENALGTVLEYRGKLDDARRQYEGAFRLAPGLLEARHNLAMLFVKQEQPWLAIDAWLVNLRFDRQHEPSLFHLAQLYRKQKQYAEAIDLYNRLLLIRSDHLEAAEGLGIALAKSGDSRARGQLEEALAMRQALRGTASAEAYEALGDVYRQDPQRSALACRLYRQAESSAKARRSKVTRELKQHLKGCPA